MLTFTQLQRNPRGLLALTGLTLSEFQLLLAAFRRSYDRLFPADRTHAGRPYRRLSGAGRKAVLASPEQRLLFILVYLKTYPLQVVIGKLFDLSQSRANRWIQRLLPVLQDALDELGVLPERNPCHVSLRQPTNRSERRLIIDGTDRRRQRPKNPEKQALHYSGKKKTHTDKNVVVVDARSDRIVFLSQTYAGKVHDKKIADAEKIVYPPGTVLYKDTGFQGYEPEVKQTCQAKKKAAPREAHGRRKGDESKTGAHSRACGA